jgi:hypothetical protein
MTGLTHRRAEACSCLSGRRRALTGRGSVDPQLGCFFFNETAHVNPVTQMGKSGKPCVILNANNLIVAFALP